MHHAHHDHAGRQSTRKAEAAGVRVGHIRKWLIEQAIRLFMLAAPSRSKRKGGFELVTFGAGGHFSKRNIDKISVLLEVDDLDAFARHQ